MQPYIITYIIILAIAIIGFCYAGKYIAEQKGRSPTEGILFGLLGILGLVILALLPSKDKSEIDSNSNPVMVTPLNVLAWVGLISLSIYFLWLLISKLDIKPAAEELQNKEKDKQLALCISSDKNFITSKMQEMNRDVLSIQNAGYRKYYVTYISWTTGKGRSGDEILDYSNRSCD